MSKPALWSSETNGEIFAQSSTAQLLQKQFELGFLGPLERRLGSLSLGAQGPNAKPQRVRKNKGGGKFGEIYLGEIHF